MPYGVVFAREKGDLELRTHAVGAAHQHRVAHTHRQAAQPREAAHVGDHLRAPGAGHHRRDAVDDGVSRFHVYARVPIGESCHLAATRTHTLAPASTTARRSLALRVAGDAGKGR
jgi:hypothetical protein